MLRDLLIQLIASVRDELIAAGRVPEVIREAPIEISDTKSPEHGDFACNLAMVSAKRAGTNPRALAELLQGAILGAGHPVVSGVEVAGPGFLNLRLNPAVVAGFIPTLVEQGNDLAKSKLSDPLNINVEFVSVNPNGPITVGSGRGAAFGSALAAILEAAGNNVHREYYINDGVNSEQMRLFAESVRSYAQDLPFPEKGYKGEYVKDVAGAIGQSSEEGIGWWQSRSQELMIQRQRDDLAGFGVEFDTWFSEQSLHDQGVVERLLAELAATNVADTKPERTKLKMGRGGVIESVEIEAQTAAAKSDDEEGDSSELEAIGETLWLRSTKFGDDMDRVLRRRDGRLTYIASDVAYHADKFNRGSRNGDQRADKLITVLGPDHHGYIARLQAVVAALLEASTQLSGELTSEGELDESEARIFASVAERDACRAALAEARKRLEVVIFQIVRFVKDGQPAPMRKRDGNIYELRDLIQELGASMAPNADRAEQQRIGRDVARFFYLMRSHDTHMDFDIDLATKQSDENPVFYVQYAHARICSVLDKARGAGFEYDAKFDHSQLVQPQEQALLRKIMDLPYEVRRTAQDYAVNRITNYAIELARAYHHFYDGCRVIQADQPELSRARVALCEAARTGLRATLHLLGVSAPNRMDRSESSLKEE